MTGNKARPSTDGASMTQAQPKTPTIADYAAAYVKQFGMALVPLPPKQKRPLTEDWGNQVITDPAKARAYYTEHANANMGVALGPSRLCSFDVDDIEATRLIFDEFGWDLDALRDGFPTIQGAPGGFRVMFRVPDDMRLPYHSLTWPKKDGTRGRFTVWEIRSADDTQQRQDVLPPSIHPETGEPYKWLTKPDPATGLLPPPEFLLRIWENWDALKPQFQSVCPWAEQPQTLQRQRPAPERRDSASVIDAYANAVQVEQALQQYGYKQQGKRWLSPHSKTKLPGVVVMGGKAFIHHASDPLCTDESGRPVDAFDLFCEYEHGGDKSKAMRAAAVQLGMEFKRPPAPQRPQRPAPEIDPDTGEIMPANDNAGAIFDPAAVDWYAPFPDVNGKGKPKATIENVADAARRLGVNIRYNVIKKDVEILIPGARFTIDNQANASLAWLASNCTRFDIPTGPLGEYVNYLADQNLHNPVANWVTCKPWDGVSRLQQFYETIEAEGQADEHRVMEQKIAMMRRWMISAIAAAFRPNGVSAHGVLVLQGDQYLGKTKWFKSLVPAELGVIQDGLMLRPDDRDSVKQVVSYWLVELGELDATFRKSDIAQLKSFLTRDRDVLRRAYAKMESEYARRTVFFASVNPRQFLHDPTGNRRYWTICCTKINHDHGLDMQQVWAEVHEQHYMRGETWYLTPDEMQALNDNNRDHEVLDPIRERLQSRFDWDAPASMWRWMTATDAMAEIGFDRPTRADVTQAGQILQELNGQQRRKSNGRLLAKVPPKLH
jgi:predicted P-loop ATPase